MDSMPDRGLFCGEDVYLNGTIRFEAPIHLLDNLRAYGVCHIGMFTYVGNNSYLFNADIGRYNSIAANVCIGPNEHPTGYLMTHPIAFQASGCPFFGGRNEYFYAVAGDHAPSPKQNLPTVIGNDVWIGHSAIITKGVKVGDGAVIAAGAVVTKDVEPYEIVGGVPAKTIRRRLRDDQIVRLLKIKLYKWDLRTLKRKLSFEDIDGSLQVLEEALEAGLLREVMSSRTQIRSPGNNEHHIDMLAF